MSDTKRILCFGDSLTWGWVPIPDVVPTTRYSYAERWTGQMATALGDGYEIIEEGLSGRTTDVDDPGDARLNGSAYLPAALASHLPLDLVIIMLGTNDTKTYFNRSPTDIAVGASKLLAQVATSAGGVGTAYPAPRALLVAPPPLASIDNGWLGLVFTGGHEKTKALAGHYQALAQFFGASFFDAGSVVATEGVDGVHFTVENNAALGQALAREVRSILG